MHWRGILTANDALSSRFNTNEYVKLAEPLKLLDYAVIFHNFPDLQPVQPFAGWSKANPTDSLRWYWPTTGSSTTGKASLSAAPSGALSKQYLRASPC
jgi:hypothetical protein